MGVIVIGLRKPRSAQENFGSTWEHMGAPATSLGVAVTSLAVPATSMGAPTTCLGAPMTWLGAPRMSLGAPRITVKQTGKTTSSLGTLLVRLEIISTTYHSTIFKTHVFSLYSHLSIYTATHLHIVYLDWQQAVLESNSRCAWKWGSSELRDILRGHDRAGLERHWEAMIVRTCRPYSSMFEDTLGGHDLASLGMHLEAVIERVCRYTLEAMIKRNWTSTWRRSMDGTLGTETLFIS